MVGTCDRYLPLQMCYPDLWRPVPFRNSDLWVTCPVGFPQINPQVLVDDPDSCSPLEKSRPMVYPCWTLIMLIQAYCNIESLWLARTWKIFEITGTYSMQMVCPEWQCCEYTNIFSFSPLFSKGSITFQISFRLPLFWFYYLETMDIFPTFFPLNMLPKNPYLMKGTLGTCSKCIRNFPLLTSHV